jgi:(hydroxyamino)benzene mutase
MNSSKMLSRQGHRLLQVGIALLLFTSFEGFAIPYLAAPHLGLSAHKLSGLQSVFLFALGLVWPRLKLGAVTSRIAFWFLVYSTFAILAAYVMGALWGAGNETLRLAAADAHGSAFQEAAIRVVAYSSAPTGLISFALILWGLRIANNTAPEWIAEAPYRNHYGNR